MKFPRTSEEGKSKIQKVRSRKKAPIDMEGVKEFQPPLLVLLDNWEFGEKEAAMEATL